MRWARLRIVGLGLAVAAGLVAPPVGGADPTEAERQPAATLGVRVHVIGALGQDQELVRLVEEWLGANQIEYAVVYQPLLSLDQIRAPRGTGPPVRTWLVALGAHRARLYLAEPDAERYLVRDIPLPSGFDELGRERIVQVVLSSTLAFMEQAASSSFEEIAEAFWSTGHEPGPAGRGAARHPGPSSDPEPVELVTPVVEAGHPGRAGSGAGRWRSVLGLGAMYGVTGKGEEGIAHGPGLTLQLGRARAGLEIDGRLQGQYRLSHQADTDHIRVSVQEVVTAASIAVTGDLSGPFGWGAELGGGLQLAYLDPRSTSAQVVARDGSWDTRPFVLLATGPAWKSGEIWLKVNVRLDYQLRRTRYEIAGSAESRTELVVQAIQPGAFLEMGGSPIHF